MNDLIEVWQKPRMMISMLLTALCYAALTIPFKGQMLIPEISEIRPSAFMPVLASFIFGPAGAWGAAFGNLLGDLFGTFSASSAFGFVGNLFLGYLPYKLWFHLFRQEKTQLRPDIKSSHDLSWALGSGLIANLFCALVIAWGVFVIFQRPFLEVWAVIFINNSLSLVFLWPAMKWLVPLSEKYELNWFYQLDQASAPVSTPTQQFYMILLIGILISGTVFSLAFGLWESRLYLGNPWYDISQRALFASGLLHMGGAVVLALKD